MHFDSIRARLSVLSLLLAAPMAVLASLSPPLVSQAPSRQFTASVYTSFEEPIVETLLYNPPRDEVRWSLPYKPGSTTRNVEPVLLIYARGIPNGKRTLAYHIVSAKKSLLGGTVEVIVANGMLETAITLPGKLPEAERVAYEIRGAETPAIKGSAPLRWSRFQGQVKYLDGGWRSTYIEMFPNGFRAPGSFYVPVGDDGRFDALVPARVYSVLNVNGAGYKYDALERWAWDYDLTRPREDIFTIGRMEIYAMRAFDLNSPLSTIFVMFRPTALSRMLRFDVDGDGLISDAETKAALAEMKDSPTVIGPELKAGDVKVWLNGKEEKIFRFDRIPEYDEGLWQVQYVLQIYPETRPPRGIWHELKVEVRSREMLRGREIIDFGQGSVGFHRY